MVTYEKYIPILLIIKIIFGLQWPWMVSIQVKQGQGFVHICGGSVIESNLVLTAAHCMKDKQITEMNLVFGTGDLSLSGPFRTERTISEFIIHPLYNDGESYFDAAVLVLEKELDFNEGIQKICMPPEATLDANHRSGDSATLTGWGATKPGGLASTELGHAAMMIFAEKYCNKSRIIKTNQEIESESPLVPNLFHSPVFCAGLSIEAFCLILFKRSGKTRALLHFTKLELC